MSHPLAGRKQSPEHIKKRMDAVAKAKATWTQEQRDEFSKKIRESNKKRSPETFRGLVKFSAGGEPWNKGKKCPQISGQNHWNWGNNMPQESIEKMRLSLSGKKQSPGLIQKRIAGRAGYAHSMETKVKIGAANSREGNGNWLGGMSREPYALIWGSRLFKGTIRERDGHACQNPECKKTCNVLTIHHIDYDKKNCDPKNLITLCRACNGRANFNRDFWEAGYNEIIRLKYEAVQQTAVQP
jgi:5-methylcytosine-specific restriction endonuclease McrA